jgi:hypothetical protein
MAHHYGDYIVDNNFPIKKEDKKEESSKEDKDSSFSENADKTSPPLPKTNIPACSNITE